MKYILILFLFLFSCQRYNVSSSKKIKKIPHHITYPQSSIDYKIHIDSFYYKLRNEPIIKSNKQQELKIQLIDNEIVIEAKTVPKDTIIYSTEIVKEVTRERKKKSGIPLNLILILVIIILIYLILKK